MRTFEEDFVSWIWTEMWFMGIYFKPEWRNGMGNFTTSLRETQFGQKALERRIWHELIYMVATSEAVRGEKYNILDVLIFPSVVTYW